MTHTQYLNLQKAYAHTESARTGASYPEVAAFLIACARVFQSQAEYDHAQHCLEASADLYVMRI